MYAVRSRHGKVALVTGGNAVLKIILLDGYGPKFAMVPAKDFKDEFNSIIELPIVGLALSFVKAVKRAFRHNDEVVKFLLEEILMKNITDMTLAEITLRYNELAVAAGKKTRKAFDSKRLALEAIEKLDAEVRVATPVQTEAAEKSTKRRSTSMTEAVEKKPRGKGIGALAMELLLEGKTTAEVIEIVTSEIDGAHPTRATIAWYKNKLRAEGKLAPSGRKTKAAEEDLEEAA